MPTKNKNIYKIYIYIHNIYIDKTIKIFKNNKNLYIYINKIGIYIYIYFIYERNGYMALKSRFNSLMPIGVS